MSIVSSVRRVGRELHTAGLEVRRRYGVGRARQLREMLHYYRRIETGREEYYSFELYRPDRSETDKLKFLSQKTWRRVTPRLNKRGARFTVHRKSVFGSLLRGWNIPAPMELALIDVPVDEPFEAWRAREGWTLQRLLEAAAEQGLVWKADSAEWGMDVLVFVGVEDESLIHTTGKRYSLQQLHATLQQQQLRPGNFPKTSRFVIQQRVLAHETLRAFHPVTLPTIRIVSCLDRGEAWIPRAALKLPVGRSGVDNFHAGGVACAIDPETGTVAQGISKSGFEWLSVHPESGIRFDGLALPFWSDAIHTVKRAAVLFSDLKTVGWDLALTGSGPLVIEANYEWGVDIVQRPHREGINQGRFLEWWKKAASSS